MDGLFDQPGFLRFMLGAATSLLGEQFTMIALAWLVFQLTGDGLVLGSVIACLGMPKVLFLLFAGALVDRHSPRLVLVAASLCGAVLLAALGVMVMADALTLPGLYAVAVLMGLVGAFTAPARMAILPRIVAPRRLQQANAAMMSATQVSILIGPVLAGLLISTPRGLGMAFLVDAACFLLAALTVPALAYLVPRLPGHERGNLANAVTEGVRSLWTDKLLRTLTLYWSIAVLLASGPIQVGLPILVRQQLEMGSAAFGLMIASNGFGQLLGMVLSGLHRRGDMSLGLAVCVIDALVGASMLGMGFNRHLVVGMVLMFAVGAGAGYVQVRLFTWIQQRIPEALLGRVTSVMILTMTAIAPLSALLAGVAARHVPITMLFAIGGLSLSVFALASTFNRTLRSVRTA